MFNGYIYNTTFFYYDTDGSITLVSNIKVDSTDPFLEIDNKLVEGFLSKNPDIKKYKINYFLNLLNGTPVEEERTYASNNALYILPLVNSFNNEITLEHAEFSWILHARDNIKYDLDVNFYISRSDDLNCYIKYLDFNLSNRKEIAFTTEIEKDITAMSITTQRKFNSYGVKEKK